MAKRHWINSAWVDGSGPELSSTDPASGEVIWSGATAGTEEIEAAFGAARRAFERWGGEAFSERVRRIRLFQERLLQHREALGHTLSRETGKPLWESLAEVDAMRSKVSLAIEAHEARRQPRVESSGNLVRATRFKPHGVTVVFGPFNLPAHLPHAHILPSLVAGNTVIFKPSEQAPLVGEHLARIWEEIDLPEGVINMVQGGAQTGQQLAAHPELDGLYFTGGYSTGLALHRMLASLPQKILALEMGGNNPLVVWDEVDPDAAVYHTIQSAFLTAGQRCTCARRLIVPKDERGDRFLERLLEITDALAIGPYTSNPEPFMGPVISPAASEKLQAAQNTLIAQGAMALRELHPLGSQGTLLRPAILDVTAVQERPDEEFFGPFLQVVRVSDFQQAIDEANRTAFGLAAGLLSPRRESFEAFYAKVRAGIINWNRPTTGAGGTMPFGGVGLSGNHRPSGYFAADYCAYPVACSESPELTLPETKSPGLPL